MELNDSVNFYENSVNATINKKMQVEQHHYWKALQLQVIRTLF